MAAPKQGWKLAEHARQWQRLAERRRAHLLELQRSGRWQRYYTEEQLKAQIEEATRRVEEWRALTGVGAKPEPGPRPQAEAAE